MGNVRSKQNEQVIVPSIDNQSHLANQDQDFEDKRNEHDASSFEAQKDTLFMMTREVRYNDALNFCERLFEKFPDQQAHIYFLRGEVYYRMKRDRPALLDFNKAEELGDTDAELYLKRGNLYRRRGYHSEALKDFNHSLSIKEDFYVYQLRAELYRDGGNYKAAEQDLKKALHLKSHRGVWFDLAELYYFQGQLHLAEWVLNEHVLPSLPDHQKGNQRVKKLLENIKQKATEQKFQLFESIRNGRLIEESKIEDLFNAVKHNRDWQINELLKPVGRIDITVRDLQGNTLLHAAAAQGHTELLFNLAQQGIDLQSINEEKETPLVVAVKASHVELVQRLLHAGINPCQRWQGKTILHLAIEQADLNLIQKLLVHEALLKETGGLIGVLTFAITVRQNAVIESLLDEFPQLANEAYNGQYPLHTAIQQCQIEHVHNPDIEQRQIDIIIILLRYQAKPDVSIPPGQTPLELAESINNDRIINLLHNHQRQYELDESAAKARIETLITRIQKRVIEKSSKRSTRYNNPKRWAQVAETIRNTLPENWKVWSWLCQADIDLNSLETLEETLAHQLIDCRKAIFTRDKKRVYHYQPIALSQLLQDNLNKWEPKIEPIQQESNPGQPDSPSDEVTNKATQSSIEIRNFCNRFETRFDEMYRIFWAFYSEQMEYKSDSQDKAVDLAQQVASQAPDIPLPVIPGSLPTSILANVAAGVYHYVRNHFRQEQARRMVQLFSALTPLERTEFVHEAALAIAKRYQMQINYLNPGSLGVEQFADCVVQRVIHYITRKDDHQYKEKPGFLSKLTRQLARLAGKRLPREEAQKKELTHLFFDGIIKNQPDDKAEEMTLRTHGQTGIDEWTSRGILENTGVLTRDGIRYAHPDRSSVEKYGYCYGDEAEADLRGFTNEPKKGDEWPVGRFAAQSICEENSSSGPPQSPSISIFSASRSVPEIKDEQESNQTYTR